MNPLNRAEALLFCAESYRDLALIAGQEGDPQFESECRKQMRRYALLWRKIHDQMVNHG